MRYLSATLILAASVALLGACERERSEPELPSRDVMQGAPVFYPSHLVDRSGSAETIQLTYQSAVGRDSIAAWYRDAFAKRGWDVVGDVVSPDGSVTMHVARDSAPPLWVMIKSHDDGAEFSVIGAESDTTSRTP